MTEKSQEPIVGQKKAYILAGVITVIPLVITLWVVRFILNLLREFGGPAVAWLAFMIRPLSPEVANLLLDSIFDSVLAVILALIGLYLLGWIATRMVGKRLLSAMDALVNRIPFVRTVYSSVQKFLAVLEQRPNGVHRVVLIDFPSPEMKTVGFVTRTLEDANTGRLLAAVYVPTTPNPTSGYLEIVPLEKVTSTDWSMDEAMTFIMSGGAVAPPTMNYYKGVGRESLEDQGPAAAGEGDRRP